MTGDCPRLGVVVGEPPTRAVLGGRAAPDEGSGPRGRGPPRARAPRKASRKLKLNGDAEVEWKRFVQPVPRRRGSSRIRVREGPRSKFRDPRSTSIRLAQLRPRSAPRRARATGPGRPRTTRGRGAAPVAAGVRWHHDGPSGRANESGPRSPNEAPRPPDEDGGPREASAKTPPCGGGPAGRRRGRRGGGAWWRRRRRRFPASVRGGSRPLSRAARKRPGSLAASPRGGKEGGRRGRRGGGREGTRDRGRESEARGGGECLAEGMF